jgi:hypothetical protein
MLNAVYELGCFIVSDVDHYVIVRKSLGFIFKLVRYPYVVGKYKCSYIGLLFRKVGYTKHDKRWFLEWVDSSSAVFE